MSQCVGLPLNLCVAGTSTETSTVHMPPEINMSVNSVAPEPAMDSSTISDNNANNDCEYTLQRSTKNSNKYSDCRLSGVLDRVHLDWDVSEIMNTSSNTCETTNGLSDQAEDSVEADLSSCNSGVISAKPVPDMISCMVQLDKLMNQDINYWSNPCSSGYFLHMRTAASTDSRPYWNAKQNINYFSDADTSSSEDCTVSPGKWSKSHVRNIYHPSRGPSKAHIAAQLSIQKKKELVAAEDLLSLQQASDVNTESDDTTGDNTDSRISSSSGKSESTHTLSSISVRNGDDDDSTHSENCSTCDDSNSSISEKDDDDVPLAKIKQELADQDIKP